MTQPTTPKSSLAKKILLILALIVVIALTILYFVFNFTYSEGTRAGVLYKFSKRGYVFKTYEGELNIGGVGNIPNTAQGNMVWNFSVTDKAFADTLHNYEGKKVSLHYKEKIKSFWWQGETNYFVDGVEAVE